ncbi:Ig-like domain (group 2) [bacterium JGI 053]|nr:Ig-like domain (group 2) [bacterium JGI 053]
MRMNRLSAFLLAACLIVPATSCGGDGGSPTGTQGQGGDIPGSAARANGVQLSLVSGGGQTGVAGQPLANPVVVRVLDGSSRAVGGATVNFIAGQGSASPTQANTDAEGYAQTTWTLGPAGRQELRVAGTGGTLLLVSAEAVPPARVARVQVIPDSLVLAVGATGDFTAVAFDSAGNALTGRTIAWSSANPAIASVGSTGTVTGAAAGATRVTATVDGVSGSAPVRVDAPPPVRVARVVVGPDSLVLIAGATGDLNAVAYDAEGHVLTGYAVTWTSSDSTVATVGAAGGVTAVSPGSARVTATVEGVSGVATVRVVPPPPVRVARVVVEPDSLVLIAGATGDLNAVAYDAEGHILTGRAVMWSSSDSTVATVGAAGGVTAVSAGSARVTATVEGVGGVATVFVRAPAPAGVARVDVVPDSLVLDVGQTGDFDAVAYDAEGHVLTGRAITWTSSDSTVATVGAGGGVTAVSPGTARVTATVEGVGGVAAVFVRAPAPAGVARVDVVPDSLVLDVGQTGDFDAVAYDAAGNVLTGRTVTWSTADSGVVAVGAGGSVTGVAPGTARVRATVEGVTGAAAVRVREPAPSAVARVYLRPDSLILEVGLTGSFTAVAYDAEGNVLTGRRVAWSSADSTIARVAAGGTITAVAVGRVRITATVEGVSYSAPVRVVPLGPVRVARVAVVPDSAVIDVGGTVRFTAVAYDSAGNVLTGRPVHWFSYNTAIATVDGTGLVTGTGEGQIRIQADVDSTKSGSGIVRVRGIPAATVARVRVVPDSADLARYASMTFSAVAYDAAGNVLTGRTVRWSSSDTTRLKVVSGGTVTAVGTGTVHVIANVEGITGQGTVRIPAQAPPTINEVVVWTSWGYAPLTNTGEVDVAKGDAQMFIQVGASRRISSLSLRVRGPDGTLIDCPRGQDYNSVTHAEWRCDVSIPAGSAPGVWLIDRVTIDDSTTYTNADLVAQKTNGRGFDIFNTARPDNAVPQVRSVFVQPEGATGWQNGRYYVNLGLLDHVTGVHAASMTLRGPAGQTETCTAVYSPWVDAVLRADWLCAFDTLPRGSGTWRLESVTVTDGTGLTATYTAAQLDRQRGLVHVWRQDYEYQLEFQV